MPTTDPPNNSVQTIEQLTQRFRELDTEKTRVQTLVDASKERLEELLVEAEEKFGSRDIEQLRAQLKKLETENAGKRKKYQGDLDQIELRLAEIEEQFVDLELESEES